jgi:hypothetical protein
LQTESRSVELGIDAAVRVKINLGTSDLRLAGLPLTSLDVNMGAGTSTFDLNGDWAHDLDVTVDSGAATIRPFIRTGKE